MGLFETREEDLIGEDGLKREEVRGNYRQLHNVGLHVFYSVSEIVWVVLSRRLRFAGQVGRLIGACKIFVRKPQRNRPLGIPMRGSQDYIKMNLT